MLQKLMEENRKQTELRINQEIKQSNAAYKVKDKHGNVFVFAYIENGYPVYRGLGGQKHIFDLSNYVIIEQYVTL